MLLDKGLNINAKDDKSVTPLHVAVENDNVEMVKFLIEHGANVNHQDYHGNTPLIAATKEKFSICKLRAKEVVRLLAENGANVTLQNLEKNTALHFAKAEDLAQILLENGAKTNVANSKGETPKDISIKYRIPKVTQLIVEYENKQKIERNEQIDCIICFEPKNGTYAFLPCGHAKTCQNCCKNIMKPNIVRPECPTCRQPVTTYQKIFI